MSRAQSIILQSTAIKSWDDAGPFPAGIRDDHPLLCRLRMVSHDLETIRSAHDADAAERMQSCALLNVAAIAERLLPSMARSDRVSCRGALPAMAYCIGGLQAIRSAHDADAA